VKRINEEKQYIINGGATYYTYSSNAAVIAGNIQAPVIVVQLINNIITNTNVNVNVNIGNIGPH